MFINKTLSRTILRFPGSFVNPFCSGGLNTDNILFRTTRTRRIETVWTLGLDSSLSLDSSLLVGFDLRRNVIYLTPVDEEICGAAENPQAMKETKAKEHFFRTRPDGIAHHNENKIWYLMEFKRTSDVLLDYLERKDKMASKQYENFMNILRKVKKPGWTSDQLNFIVGSKTINENAMDTNLERLGINQKNKMKIKATTAKANIHGLLNILKAYYANTHQDSPKPKMNEGTDDLQLVIDTRQALGKRVPNDKFMRETTPP
jgi:hypothetical protein